MGRKGVGARFASDVSCSVGTYLGWPRRVRWREVGRCLGGGEKVGADYAESKLRGQPGRN